MSGPVGINSEQNKNTGPHDSLHDLSIGWPCYEICILYLSRGLKVSHPNICEDAVTTTQLP